MGQWASRTRQVLAPHRVPRFQFALEVRPFERELSSGFRDAMPCHGAAELAGIEVVTTPHRLVIDRSEIGVEACDRIRLVPKPDQLGMVTIPTGPPPQHDARQERLAPQRDESTGIEVLGMQRPEAHGRLRSFGPRESPHRSIGR